MYVMFPGGSISEKSTRGADRRPRLDAWGGRSDLVRWGDLEGSGGGECGRGDWDVERMWTHGCFISMYNTVHYNKRKKFKKKVTWELTLPYVK